MLFTLAHSVMASLKFVLYNIPVSHSHLAARPFFLGADTYGAWCWQPRLGMHREGFSNALSSHLAFGHGHLSVRHWKLVIPLQEVWLGKTSHKLPSAYWVLEKNGIVGLQSSMQLQSASWECLSTAKGVIFSTRWWSSGLTGHVASQLASVSEDIKHWLQAISADCTPRGGHVSGAGGCTLQPRQRATVSSWKVALWQSLCIGMGMCHTCSRIQWVSAMETYPHLSLTSQVSTAYCIILDT